MSGELTAGSLVLNNTTNNEDAFNRFRVSEPVTLFDVHHTYDKNPIKIAEVTNNDGGAAASTYNANAYVAMTLDSSAGASSYVIRQSKEYIPYQPGKSKLILLTGILETSGGATSIVCRIGAFDANEGHFFELDGTTLYIVERTGASDTRVAQSSWNLDVLDGTGTSSKTVNSGDFSKSMIFVIDLEWL